MLEEFGLARDWETVNDIYNSNSTTTHRDVFYTAMFEAVYNSAASNGSAAGFNFWAWGGHARPGDSWVGDPPHEPPGWYSVYNADASTVGIIKSYAEKVEMTNGE